MPKAQTELPGVEAPTIKEIEEAAENYVAVRNKRMSLTEKEIAAKTNLTQVMQEHASKLGRNADGNSCYRYDDQIVILSDKINVRVKTDHAEDDDED